MAAQGNMKLHEQEHPSAQEQSRATDQATKQAAGAKADVVLDQFEIQRRLFFGK